MNESIFRAIRAASASYASAMNTIFENGTQRQEIRARRGFWGNLGPDLADYAIDVLRDRTTWKHPDQPDFAERLCSAIVETIKSSPDIIDQAFAACGMSGAPRGGLVDPNLAMAPLPSREPFVPREFTCPICRTHRFGSSLGADGKLMRMCHGYIGAGPAGDSEALKARGITDPGPIYGCPHRWHQDQDDLYFAVITPEPAVKLDSAALAAPMWKAEADKLERYIRDSEQAFEIKGRAARAKIEVLGTERDAAHRELRRDHEELLRLRVDVEQYRAAAEERTARIAVLKAEVEELHGQIDALKIGGAK